MYEGDKIYYTLDRAVYKAAREYADLYEEAHSEDGFEAIKPAADAFTELVTAIQALNEYCDDESESELDESEFEFNEEDDISYVGTHSPSDFVRDLLEYTESMMNEQGHAEKEKPHKKHHSGHHKHHHKHHH